MLNYQHLISQLTVWKTWLDNQKKNNYRNEYDRVVSVLSQSHLPGTTVERLKKRKTELSNLLKGNI